ncbi:MAG: hypothetical protein ACRERU_16135, partial [Methylococcales bacterium]
MINSLSKFFSPAALLILAGCESLGPSMRDKLPLEPVAMVKDNEKQQHETQFTDLGLRKDGEGQKKPAVEMYPGSGNYINSGAARGAAGRVDTTG